MQGRRVIPSLSAGTWIHRSVPCKYILGPGDTRRRVLVPEQTRSCSPGTVCAEDHTGNPWVSAQELLLREQGEGPAVTGLGALLRSWNLTACKEEPLPIFKQ